MSERFDTLTQAMAGATSRRGLLKAMIGAAAGAAVGLLTATFTLPREWPLDQRIFTNSFARRVTFEAVDTHELLESQEHVSHAGNRQIGVTMATFAAALALVTMMGHRLHTEEVVMQTQVADGWAFFQAKNSRSQMYAADAKLSMECGPGIGPSLSTSVLT